jgi:hypothetical protein
MLHYRNRNPVVKINHGSAKFVLARKLGYPLNVDDDDIDLFIEKMEEVLKRFAGEAYHFRYDIEKFVNGASSKPQGNIGETHNGNKCCRL